MSPWELAYDHWDPAREPRREALCALGNGLFATRAAAEWAPAGGPHYPGTYVNGGYDRQTTHLAGRAIENEDFVNFPNWLLLRLRPEDGDWLDLRDVEILDYTQRLDLRRGVLLRALRFRDRAGRTTRLDTERIVSMHDPHLAAIRWRVEPLDWSGRVVVRTALDAAVINDNVPRYRELVSSHLRCEITGRAGDDLVFLRAETRQSGLRMAQAARTRVRAGGHPLPVPVLEVSVPAGAASDLLVDARAGEPFEVEKVVSVFTSRDAAISEPLEAACARAAEAESFDALLTRHAAAWKDLWERCDLVIEGHDETQALLRLHVFHLLQVCSPHVYDRDVGVPARGLHGEAYRGHVLWDEVFVFPFLDLRIPDLTRELLLYRCRRLDAARRLARAAGHEGAMFPWQSGSSGREETPAWHLNPRSGRWIPDESQRQRHVGGAVAYNVWKHFEATNDRAFLADHGAELLLSIARFFGSLATWDPDLGRWRILGVMGPDEYHEGYPDGPVRGVDDSAYTNVLVAWVLGRAIEVLDLLPERRARELRDQLGLDDDVLARWDAVRRGLHLVFDEEGGILAQFDGWQDLRELDWDAYRTRYGNIERLDRILEAEGDSTNRYKVAKQADVLMLFYLFSTEELSAVLRTLGYAWDDDFIPRNLRYYEARTSHGSTLSRVVHAWVLARSDRPRSWAFFREALRADIDDLQGGTTPEGIHLGAMAGTVDFVQRCYTGLEARDGVLWLNPRLPDELRRLEMPIRYHGQDLYLRITHDELFVRFDAGQAEAVLVGFRGEVVRFAHGESRRFPLRQDRRPDH